MPRLILQETWSNLLIQVHWHGHVHLEEMVLELIGVYQSYPWGIKDAIPTLLDRPADDQPWMEQQLGIYPLGDSPTSGGSTLSEYLAQDPNQLSRASVMTFGRRLSLLVKALPAASPLSLQTHPTRQQTRDDHTRESLIGTPLDVPERLFKGDWPRPKTIVTLTSFKALVGFRDPLLTTQLFRVLEVGDALASVTSPLRDRIDSPALQKVFLDTLSLDDRRRLVDEVLGAAANHLDTPGGLGVFARTAVEIDEYLPSGPDILAVLLLNRFSPESGWTLTLPPGMMHSCLRGTRIEVMANSDNMLCDGLTGRHTDVDALLYTVDFTPSPGDALLPSGSDGTYIYLTSFEEPGLWLLQPVDEDTLQAPCGDLGRICLVASGSFELTGDGDPVVLKPEHAVFVAAEEAVVARGEGQLFAAVTGA